MTATPALIMSLEAISYQATIMVAALDGDARLPTSERREVKRRVLEIQTLTQELIDWLSEARLEDPRN